METNELNGKIAIVTGAGGGIGSALVKKLTEKGVFCIMVDMHESSNSNLVELARENKGEYFSVDLTDIPAIDKFYNDVVAKYDKIDFLYNVAGTGIYKKIGDLTIEDWNLSIGLNLTAPFYLTKKLIPLLQKSDKPLVLNIGSGMGVFPTAGRSAYCASKFGLRGLTLSLAKEFKDDKIKFQLLTLGSVMTGFGDGGVDHKKDLQKTGKQYLTTESVSEKIVGATVDRNSPTEIEFYPEGYKEENT
ncbi:MAG: SDR family oxidoreductase [Candidatus Woesebacteria bacterium]|nr:MAG: SDR family oxidoreductase [Candidatus Woesebacteria bacterium]